MFSSKISILLHQLKRVSGRKSNILKFHYHFSRLNKQLHHPQKYLFSENAKKDTQTPKQEEKSSSKEDLKFEESKQNLKSEKKEEEIKKQDSKKEETQQDAKQEEKKEDIKKESFREQLKKSYPKVSTCLEFSIKAWKMTFPKDNYIEKFQKTKQKMKEQKEEEMKKYTEAELLEMQEKIPEWKRTALQVKDSEAKDETSIKEKLKSKFKNKFNETKFAKNIYDSDQYKEFQNFKKEMHQFKEDLKDHVENSPSPIIQASLNIYSKASNESSVAKAIKEMRNLDPTFSVWELEDDAKGIFEAAYTTYLQANMELLEKMCGEMALGYFKVLLRRMEAEKCEPKYKYLWQIDDAQFVTATIPEKKLPVFIFSIKTQEIHCNISKIDRRIVDGDDERLMHYEYSFALTPHTNPDLENVGHGWELIEIQPRQVVKMLV